MDSTIINLAKDSGDISGTMIVLIVFVAVWAFERIYKITQYKKSGNPTWSDVNKKFKTKEDCSTSMERLGKAVDKVEHVNNKQDDAIKGVEVGMAFMVGKMGGDYKTLKKNGG